MSTPAGATSGVPSRYVEHVMGMPISLALRGRHAGDAVGRTAWAETMAVLHEADRIFSTYRPDSFVSRLRRSEIALQDCPPEVAEVLALGDLAERQSGGAFRVQLPGPDGVLLDPSGVVKGWAAERAAMPLRGLEATDFSLSAGGDVVCRTVDPLAPPWRIGIEDPRNPGRVVAVVPVGTGAVATSGSAHRGRHIVDARTGRPPTGVASVTVVADSLTWADIDATAAFARGEDAARWLATRPGRTGLVVWADGSTSIVQGPAVELAIPPRSFPADRRQRTHRPFPRNCHTWQTRSDFPPQPEESRDRPRRPPHRPPLDLAHDVRRRTAAPRPAEAPPGPAGATGARAGPALTSFGRQQCRRTVRGFAGVGKDRSPNSM